MPFAPRLQDKKWMLCARKGPTYEHFDYTHTHKIWFPNRALAVAACTELNEYWDQYMASKPERKRKRQPKPKAEMWAILEKFGGLHET